jgi:hypothetical protein
VGQKHLSGTKDVILIPNDLQHIDSAGLILTWTQPKSQWIARTERQKVATLSWLSSFGSRRLQFFAPVFSLSIGLMSQVHFSTLRCLL